MRSILFKFIYPNLIYNLRGQLCSMKPEKIPREKRFWKKELVKS